MTEFISDFFGGFVSVALGDAGRYLLVGFLLALYLRLSRG